MPLRDPNALATTRRPPSRLFNSQRSTATPQSESMFKNLKFTPGALWGFDHASQRWVEQPLRSQRPSPPCHESESDDAPVVVRRRTVSAWNICAGGWKDAERVERTERIVRHILEGPRYPDILVFEEVLPPVREFLLGDRRVRERYLTTDNEDETALNKPGTIPFSTVTLMSKRAFGSSPLAEKDGGEGGGEGDSITEMELDSDRMDLPSRNQRDMLCVNIVVRK
ncbi:hypothetical protein DFP72DRAFT_1059312 [Ephemerocybe angulata]|uniref:Endonuclease/exonuclease/phosphatase domain-containing protein n=1 Tax=Ephemerocybe angulata TaxID=980116 RepID=A0A8H6IEW3_9AGAR|nr:hypothetical protein DFP72DRAFT_1059312 [Tulosesus angulatus]